MLITQSAAAAELGLTRQALNDRIRRATKAGKKFNFTKKDKKGKIKIDNEHPDWKLFKTNYAAKIASVEMRKKIEKKKPVILQDSDFQTDKKKSLNRKKRLVKLLQFQKIKLPIRNISNMLILNTMLELRI